MPIIRITKEFNFEMAHALAGYDGHCRNIHGHSYQLSVTVKGVPVPLDSSPKLGMVLDFGILKAIVKPIIEEFDHALVLNNSQKNDFDPNAIVSFGNIIFVDYQPTSENLIIDFAARINENLPPGIELHSMKLRETGTSFAEWFAGDQK